MLPTIKYITIPAYYNEVTKQNVTSHRLCYNEWHNDIINAPVVICLHGLTRNSRDFDVLANVLSSKFRVLTIDIVGRGGSDHFADKQLYNYSTYLADLLHLIQELKLLKINIVGTSMGGIISVALAANHPELVHNIILNDIGPNIPAGALAKIGKYAGLQPNFANFELAKNYFKLVMTPFGVSNDNEEYWQHITKYGTTIDKDGKYQLTYDAGVTQGMKISPNVTEDVDFWNLWQQISCPVMVIRGEKSDILTIPTTKKMLSSKNNIQLLTVANAGHTPALIDENQTIAIYDWLSKFDNE